NLINVKTLQNLWWLGGTPVLCGKTEYRWLYLMEEQTVSVESGGKFGELVPLLMALRPEASENERSSGLEEISKNPSLIKQLKKLHGRGLILLDF
ncbi:MAG: hypothetical protein II085_04895, partial [Alphaproteobacteria bacterium]|nr:hypothetical protein [Alphaproteobacteria bacterium]